MINSNFKIITKFVVITLGIPPAIFTASGYVVQYGAGISTSSSLSSIDINVLKIACLPPLLTTILFGFALKPEYKLVVLEISFLKTSKPATPEYL